MTRSRRLRRLAAIAARSLATLAVGAAAGGAAVLLTRAGGPIDCALPAVETATEPIPRWAFVAGIPAVITALVGAYFALGIERMAWRLVSLAFSAGLAAGVFYGVYLLLPPDCRP